MASRGAAPREQRDSDRHEGRNDLVDGRTQRARAATDHDAHRAVSASRRRRGAAAERHHAASDAAARRTRSAHERAVKRAECAMFAPRARVRRRPASSQPTPSSRRRDPSPVWLRVPCRHLRGDGADAERARVVAAVAAAERTQESAKKRAECAMSASRARVRRRPASSQPTPSSRRRDPRPCGSACLAVTSEATALTPSERESSPP